MKKMALGTKMTIGGVLLVLIPLILVGWFSVIKANDGLKNLAFSQAEALAAKLADMTQIALLEELKTAKSLAASSLMVKTSSDVASLGAQPSDDVVAPLDKELAKAMKEMGDDYEALIVIDAKGKVFAQSVDGYKELDLSQRDYFQKAMADPKQAFSKSPKRRLRIDLEHRAAGAG